MSQFAYGLQMLPTDKTSYETYMDRAFNKWILKTKPIHATIKSIKDIPIGKSQSFLCLDRNAFELAEKYMSVCREGEVVSPSLLFTDNYYIKFNKTGSGITGNYKIYCGINELLQNKTKDDIRHDFDIEFEFDEWYPLKNGVLSTSGIKWSEFPKKTRLGWRGPMIPLEHIDDFDFKF